MVLGSGIDLIEVREISRELARGAWARADGVFRDSELRQTAQSKRHAEVLAKIFVAKEAVMKALFLTPAALTSFSDIEIVSILDERIRVCLHGVALQQFTAIGAKRILVSAHSTRNLATAMAILEA